MRMEKILLSQEIQNRQSGQLIAVIEIHRIFCPKRRILPSEIKALKLESIQRRLGGRHLKILYQLISFAALCFPHFLQSCQNARYSRCMIPHFFVFFGLPTSYSVLGFYFPQEAPPFFRVWSSFLPYYSFRCFIQFNRTIERYVSVLSFSTVQDH